MTEKEAALSLGVTPRTLANYRQKGILPFREVKGKTRPAIEYQTADIERLKGQIDAKRTRSKKPTPVKTAPRIAFGIPEAERAALAEEAKKFGMSVGEYARRLVREGMESRFRQEAAELRQELAKANHEIRKMQKEYPLAFEAVLEFAGLETADAKKWVNENLR